MSAVLATRQKERYGRPTRSESEFPLGRVSQVTMDPLVLMTDVEHATERLLHTVADLEATDITRPSALPGWTIGHVVTHLARNADSLTNLLTWARTGVETPQYPTPAARDEGIEAGRARPLAAQLADLRESCERFADAAAAMPAPAWTFVFPTTGLSAAAVPWARLREVEVHHVDLGRGYTPADWSDAFTQRLLREVTGDRPEPVIIEGVRQVTIDGVTVSGPVRALAAWLSGRADGSELTSTAPLPTLPKWK
jgi:maleylpyruvate isomerase